jgi:cyclopropane fatty-acyl-phospholipid synthase-like methyltransferase
MPDASIDETKPLHWDATSQDYVRYRPGYPREFFVLLQHFGIGLPGQDILDLGSGTGALAVPFAKQGARVTAVDLSEGQLQAGRQAARQHGVDITFKGAPAESTGLADHSFDVITASMCWAYFDMKRMEVEVPRLLRPQGLLLVCSLIWIREEDPIARQTDALLARHNEKAGKSNRSGSLEIVPAWSLNRFRLKTYHEFKVDLPFTREAWRGRIRAGKWIGAALSQEQTEAFDQEHQALLEQIAPAEFNIRHRVRIQIFESMAMEN